MYKHIGNMIRTRRIEKNISQSELASKVGVSYQQIHKYESGANQVSIEKLFRIAEVLNVNFSTLLPPELIQKLTPKSMPPAQDANVIYEKEKLDLIRVFYSIKNERMRKACFELIKTMSSSDTNKSSLASTMKISEYS